MTKYEIAEQLNRIANENEDIYIDPDTYADDTLVIEFDVYKDELTNIPERPAIIEWLDSHCPGHKEDTPWIIDGIEIVQSYYLR